MESSRIAGNLEVLKEKALHLRDESLVAIADLHLGYEGALQRDGVSIPRRQKSAMLDALKRIIDIYSPETLLVNGDLKHSFDRNLDEEWLEVKEVLRFIRDRTRLVVVRGNHDNYLAAILNDMDIELRRSYRASNFTFVHGHWDVRTRGPVVMGHEHPALKLRDEVGAIVSLPAFVISQETIILPAFSPLALGVDVSSHSHISPILKRRSIRDARVLGVDEREGILDFGTVATIEGSRASLVMK